MKKTLFYDKIIKWINKLGYFGWLRFRIVYMIYSIFERENTRLGEWKFAMKYLPDVSMLWYSAKKNNIKPIEIVNEKDKNGNEKKAVRFNKITVLDVGCTDSLLLYELHHRDYMVYGIDQRDYQEKLPKDIKFFKEDLLITDKIIYMNENERYLIPFMFYYILAISTIEHIGLGTYGDTVFENGDRIAMKNLHKMLLPNGYLIITVPMAHWQSKDGKGYTHEQFLKLIDGLFNVFEMEQTHGQICAVLSKI